MNYCLAIDIGASGGRHILGYVENGALKLDEIYRFENNVTDSENGLVWDIERLTREVMTGIKKCGEIGKIPQTVAIDTWGVDYVLLDENKREILPAYAYRNNRTSEVTKKVESIISQKELYEITGTQKQAFNTVYQLYCDKLSGRLNKAKYFLMIPEYLSYRLTGVIANEFTNASTTGMLDVRTKKWSSEIIEKLGFPSELFGELKAPPALIGGFTDEMKKYAGFDASVVFCPSHDTASAVAACPIDKNSVYVSSGTWSLFGTELDEPITDDAARTANFTNEGGMNYTVRFLKNYMGMWLFQNIRRNLNKSMSYDEMMNDAIECGKYEYIDVNDEKFNAPKNMIEAIRSYLGKPDMPLNEVINSVYHSLAKSYTAALDEIEKLTGKTYSTICIVGGGSKDSYLNRLTAQYSGKRVTAGPTEATALGNLISQLIYSGELKNLSSARELIKKSFDICECK